MAMAPVGIIGMGAVLLAARSTLNKKLNEILANICRELMSQTSDWVIDTRNHGGEPDDDPETFAADGGCVVCGVLGSQPCRDGCACEDCEDGEL
jgi:hypothetical protein